MYDNSSAVGSPSEEEFRQIKGLLSLKIPSVILKGFDGGVVSGSFL